MIEIIVFLFIILFLIFFVAGIVTDNAIFGFVAGVILLLFALGIIMDGLQFTSGTTVSSVGNQTILTTNYAELTAPFSTWGILFGITLLVVSIYLFYANAMNLQI